MMHGSILWQKGITEYCKTGRNNFRSKQYQRPHGHNDAFFSKKIKEEKKSNMCLSLNHELWEEKEQRKRGYGF